MGICIDKLPHSCGTTQGLQVFADEETGEVNGYCFACKKVVNDPYGEKKTIKEVKLPRKKSPDQIRKELEQISNLPVMSVPTRKLRKHILEKSGVRVGLSEQDGETPAVMFFPMTKEGNISGYYCKTLDENKYTWSVGDVKDADPFGWEEARKSGAYTLIITEGLEDKLAVEQIYERYGKEQYQPAVISLPNGVNSVKSLLKHAEAIRNFKEIILCFDNDEPGQQAIMDAMLILPKAKSVILPEKDANDCILKGCSQAAYKALAFGSAPPKNTSIVFGNDLHEAARTPTPYGELTWPWPTMNKLLRGIRYGETIYIGAAVKMGKSELLNHIAGHFIKQHKVPVFLAKPEENNKKTYKLLCNKMVGKVFHDPEVDFDFEAYDKAGEMLKDKLMMVNLYQHLGWESLKKDIVSAASYGAKAVFIDPITNLTNGLSAADANTLLGEIAQELAAMAHDLNIVIFIFCHLKAPEGNISKEARIKKYNGGEYVGLGNCPHEFGGDVLSNQFAGSRAMMRSCSLMIGLEGNKDPIIEDETIRNMRWLSILEDREFGNSAKIPLYWNKNTTLFKEV